MALRMALWSFLIGKKNKNKEGDYHGEMNGPYYDEWFTSNFSLTYNQAVE